MSGDHLSALLIPARGSGAFARPSLGSRFGPGRLRTGVADPAEDPPPRDDDDGIGEPFVPPGRRSPRGPLGSVLRGIHEEALSPPGLALPWLLEGGAEDEGANALGEAEAVGPVDQPGAEETAAATPSPDDAMRPARSPAVDRTAADRAVEVSFERISVRLLPDPVQRRPVEFVISAEPSPLEGYLEHGRK